MAIEATLAMFGEPVAVVGVDPSAHDVIIALYGRRVRLGAPHLPLTEPNVVAATTGPFREIKCTAWTRLDWQGGSCNIVATPAYWRDRCAIADATGIAMIDASGAKHARLELALSSPAGAVAHANRLWIGIANGVLSLPLEAIEQLADTPGPIEIVARVSYPRRRPGAREPAIVAWLYGRNDAVVNVTQRQIWMDALPYGLAKGTRFTLCDELWPGEFGAIEVPGQPRRELRAAETERTFEARIALGLPPHPLHREISPYPDGFRRDRVEPLLARIADDPDDDATRGVLVDLLQQEGMAYAAQIAEVRAGSHSAIPPVIGLLAHFFQRFELRGGLPWSAELVPQPPDNDTELFELLGADVRLGLLRVLRRGNAPAKTYARVLALPMAIGVRHVDTCSRELLQLLIDLRRDRIVTLCDVNLGKARVQSLLADPTFDRAVDLHMKLQPRNVEQVLAAIAADERGCFARVPRRIALQPDSAAQHLFVHPVLRHWPALPIAAIRAGGLTLERDGDITFARVDRDAAPDVRDALVELMPGVEIRP